VGDAAARGRSPGVSPIYEDYERGLRSLRDLAALDFQVACFSHGRPITENAAAVFAKMWGAPTPGAAVKGAPR
jgi:glyoxylase-like metal-dependent hydrolase (beta-lactamase superfamily II)